MSENTLDIFKGLLLGDIQSRVDSLNRDMESTRKEMRYTRGDNDMSHGQACGEFNGMADEKRFLTRLLNRYFDVPKPENIINKP